MSLSDVVERAKVQAVAERRQWKLRLRDAAGMIRSLPELMVQERELRGLSQTAAAQQAGIQHNVWRRMEARKTTAHSSMSARVLEWMANG